MGSVETTPERPSKRIANFPTPTLESTHINDSKEDKYLLDQDPELSINFENDTPLSSGKNTCWCVIMTYLLGLLYNEFLNIIFSQTLVKISS